MHNYNYSFILFYQKIHCSAMDFLRIVITFFIVLAQEMISRAKHFR